MKNRNAKIQLGAAIITACLATNALALDLGRADDQQGMTLKSFMANGSGCPVSDNPDVMLDGNGSLDIVLSGMHAQVGPGIPLRSSRVNCQVTVEVKVPTGYTYEIATISHNGYASLDRGVYGYVKTSAYFQGSGAMLQSAFTYSGTMERDFYVNDAIDASSRLRAPCGIEKPLNINFSVRASNRSASNGQGQLMLEGKQRVKFVLKKCSP